MTRSNLSKAILFVTNTTLRGLKSKILGGHVKCVYLQWKHKCDIYSSGRGGNGTPGMQGKGGPNIPKHSTLARLRQAHQTLQGLESREGMYKGRNRMRLAAGKRNKVSTWAFTNFIVQRCSQECQPLPQVMATDEINAGRCIDHHRCIASEADTLNGSHPWTPTATNRKQTLVRSTRETWGAWQFWQRTLARSFSQFLLFSRFLVHWYGWNYINNNCAIHWFTNIGWII